MSALPSLRILLYKDLKAKGIPFSRQYISELERKGQWPQRVALAGDQGGAQVGWFEHEVDEHLLSLPRGSSMQRPPWLERKNKPTPPPPPPPRSCALPGCNHAAGERGGPRGPQPKFCPAHGRRRADQKRREPEPEADHREEPEP